MVTAPKGRGEPSLSQTAGCKSSVVAMGVKKIVEGGNVEMEKGEKKEEMEMGNGEMEKGMELEIEKKEERKENIEGMEIENAQKSDEEEEGEEEEEKKEEIKEKTEEAPISRTSIAIPLPSILEVPATQESDRLFPR